MKTMCDQCERHESETGPLWKRKGRGQTRELCLACMRNSEGYMPDDWRRVGPGKPAPAKAKAKAMAKPDQAQAQPQPTPEAATAVAGDDATTYRVAIGVLGRRLDEKRAQCKALEIAIAALDDERQALEA